MADNELDKSIEELEAEVLAELEEAAHDAPTKGAVPAEPMKKTKNGEVQDLGKAVTDPMQKDAPSKKASASAKEVGGDAAQKGEGKPEKMKKLVANYEGYTDDEIRELCHSKDHDCATVVEHPVWGMGKPILQSHAIPDDNGYFELYDVQFKHGIEEKVMAEDMEIIVSEGHHKNEGAHEDPKKMTKEKLHAAMNNMMKGEKKDMMVAMYHGMMKAKEGAHEDDEEDKEKLEAIERRSKEVDVTEAPLDSMFLTNAVAAGNADLTRIENEIPKGNTTLVFDNQPRSHEIVKIMKNAMADGWKMCVWPDKLNEKDINEMIIAGKSISEVEDLINTNTHSGLSLRLKLNAWSKC